MNIPAWLPVTTHTLPPATATLKDWARWLADHHHAPLSFETALAVVMRWDKTLPYYRTQLANRAWPCRTVQVLSAKDVEDAIFRLKPSRGSVELARALGWLPTKKGGSHEA